MAIARAVLEYCADKKTLGAKTLFATHYHELTEMENTLPGTVNYNIAVKRRASLQDPDEAEDSAWQRSFAPRALDLGQYGQAAGLHFPGNYKLFPQVHIITKRAHFDGGNGQNIFKISKTVH